MPLEEYFRCYGRIDIALDPFPYAGGTTTCDALWMGVPVVTLAGRTAVGRGGVSILSNVGLGELIAENLEAYVRIASGLAGDPGRLMMLRSTMRQRLETSPLRDGKKFAGDVESAYRWMWEGWCEARVTVYRNPLPSRSRAVARSARFPGVPREGNTVIHADRALSTAIAARCR